MITSDRNFGVEIEFYCKQAQSLGKLYRQLNLVEDGSIRHIKNSAEFVSPILNGKTGAEMIYNVCETLKKHSARGDHPAMSVHVHLDARVRSWSYHVSDVKPEGKRAIAISNTLAKKFTKIKLEDISRGDTRPSSVSGHPIFLSEFDHMLYMSLAVLKEKPKKNYKFYWAERADRTDWIRNVFYFYTLFSPVMEAIVSNSRRFGNMYCIPLDVSYSLEDIKKCKTKEEIQDLWYKHRPMGNHYDDSRYHNVNLHSIWNRHGTVEIRSHGGTVDPAKILLWVKLHQKIVDKLEDMSLADVEKLNTDDLYRSFLAFVEEPVLKNYVKRLLGFYSNIIIK